MKLMVALVEVLLLQVAHKKILVTWQHLFWSLALHNVKRSSDSSLGWQNMNLWSLLSSFYNIVNQG